VRDRPDLQLLSTGLILQVGVNPEPGQSFPTIVLESLIGYDVLVVQEIRGKFYSQSLSTGQKF
jgi:hypothetical protein